MSDLTQLYNNTYYYPTLTIQYILLERLYVTHPIIRKLLTFNYQKCFSSFAANKKSFHLVATKHSKIPQERLDEITELFFDNNFHNKLIEFYAIRDLFGGAVLLPTFKNMKDKLGAKYENKQDMIKGSPDFDIEVLPRWAVTATQKKSGENNNNNLSSYYADVGHISMNGTEYAINFDNCWRERTTEGTYYTRMNLNGWGPSCLEGAQKNIDQYQSLLNMVTVLSEKLGIIIHKYDDTQQVGQGEQTMSQIKQNAIVSNIRNIQNANTMNKNVIAIKNTEDITDIQLSNLGGFKDISEPIIAQLCNLFKIPQPLLFSQTTAGLNASTDPIIQNWFTTINGYRDHTGGISKELCSMLYMTRYNENVAQQDYTIEWQPLTEEDQAIKIQKNTSIIAIIEKAYLSGVINAKAYQQVLQNVLINLDMNTEIGTNGEVFNQVKDIYGTTTGEDYNNV